MRVVYKKAGGVASDIRFADPAYVLQQNELELQGDVLPTADALTDQAVLDARASDAVRLASLDDNIRTTSLGTVTPKTLAELRAMDFQTYSAWFDANFGTAALVIGLVKRLTLVVIRRL